PARRLAGARERTGRDPRADARVRAAHRAPVGAKPAGSEDRVRRHGAEPSRRDQLDGAWRARSVPRERARRGWLPAEAGRSGGWRLRPSPWVRTAAGRRLSTPSRTWSLAPQGGDRAQQPPLTSCRDRPQLATLARPSQLPYRPLQRPRRWRVRLRSEEHTSE